MAWERRQRGGLYYYRSVRRDGLPRKVYLGTGRAAQDQARRVAEQGRQRQAERAALLAEQTRVAQADSVLADLKGVTDLLAQAALILGGYHLRRGEWRRWRRQHEQKTQGRNGEARPGEGGPGT